MTDRTFRAVIFDLDGVLWDGEPLYHEAFNIVLAPYGHRVNDDDYDQIIGLSVEACWDWLRDRFNLSEPLARFLRAYNETVLPLLSKPVEPLPGARPLIEELRSRGVPIAVASASLRQWVDATLRGLGLQDAFDTTVSASDVDNGKPAPDLFLAAAQRLLKQALSLPMTYREPLLLRCVRALSYQQISEVLDLPITTVETRLARARRMLREEVGEEFPEDSKSNREHDQ